FKMNSESWIFRCRLQRLSPGGLTLLLVLAAGWNSSAFAVSLPRWVKTAAATPFNGNLDRSTPYIVLLDEAVTTVSKTGKAETRYRYVARILTGEGRAA